MFLFSKRFQLYGFTFTFFEISGTLELICKAIFFLLFQQLMEQALLSGPLGSVLASRKSVLLGTMFLIL